MSFMRGRSVGELWGLLACRSNINLYQTAMDKEEIVSGSVNVSFTFENNTDDISEYNDYGEKQREHHFIS